MTSPPLLAFDRAANLIHVMTGDGCRCFRACNNADSSSRGPWPVGVWRPDPEGFIAVGGEDGLPGGAYGPYFLRYVVPGRVGMGIHSGREEDVDLAGRSGPDHATKGCIRTSGVAMEEIARVVAAAKVLPVLWVAG